MPVCECIITILLVNSVYVNLPVNEYISITMISDGISLA